MIWSKAARPPGRRSPTTTPNNRYRSPKDEFNPNWNWAKSSAMCSFIMRYYAVGRALAMTIDWPNWVEGDEFRAIRDKSRQGAK